MRNVERRQSLQAELLNLGYPWPDYLNDKSLPWLEAEIRAIKPAAAAAGRHDGRPPPALDI
jgi:hypothetical protein